MTARKYFKSIDPYSLDCLGEYPEIQTNELLETIDNADRAFNAWKNTPISRKIDLILRLENVLLSNKIPYSTSITKEMGKVFKESQAEIEKCAWLCRYYAENAEEFLQAQPIQTEASLSYISYQPLGVILGIMPWNFPFWQVMRFAVPCIMAGNTVVVKHASNVQGCAQSIAFAFEQAGFPKYVYNNIPLSSTHVKNLINDRKIKGVSLTGSEKAGKSVAELAGAALKKTVLELGGSDPFLILKDADIDLAVEICLKSRMINAGQSCIGAKRIIVDKQVYTDFVEKMKKNIQKVKYGDPMDDVTNIGPLARADIRTILHKQITESIASGTFCIHGGYIPVEKAFFYPPTILVNIHENSPAYNEELFGPVLSILIAEDETEAIRLANNVNFGLGAAVFSKDIDKAKRIAERDLNAGMVFINELVKSDPRLPFGGINESGYGRELGEYGLKEFVNIKSVWIA